MSSGSRRRPSMADVAKLAGVSHQTVSRVINDDAHVRPETRARVVDAMAQLKYRRNNAARALVTRRSQMLGVVGFGNAYYGPARMLDSIESAARQAGYYATVVNLDEITPEAVRDAVDVLEELTPDGLILIVPQRDAVAALHSVSGDVPAIAVEGGQGTQDVPVVCIDQVEAGRLATRHLLDLGHATVHHIAGPSDWLEAEGRERGWRACLDEAGAPVHEPPRGDWFARSGYAHGLELAERDDLTAVFVANDQMTLGVLRAFNERGIRVPDDVSVVGVDDTPESEFYVPPLTTVMQDFDAVAQRSLEVMVAMLDDEQVDDRHALPPELVVRDSTAPPP